MPSTCIWFWFVLEGKQILLLDAEAAASGFVVLVLMSSGRVLTHALNPKVVTTFSDFST